MTTTLIIFSVVVLVCFFILIFALAINVDVLGELIVRFIETNQEYHKSQKHLLSKAGDLCTGLKRVSNTHGSIKKTVIRLESVLRKLETANGSLEGTNKQMSNTKKNISSTVAQLKATAIRAKNQAKKSTKEK